MFYYNSFDALDAFLVLARFAHSEKIGCRFWVVL